MSTTNPSLKRAHSEVDSEFPSQPDLSFADVQEFAGKSQEALVSVQQKFPVGSPFPGSSSVFLPLISPHQLQERFEVGGDDSVLVIARKSYSILKNEVDSLNNKRYAGLFVKSPVGVGKSYLLYMLASEYRLDRTKYRVTYINDCEEWRDDDLDYILREVVTTFYDDTIEGKSVVEWCQAVIASEKEEKMMMKMMEALIKYVNDNKLHWIVVCDQHNAFYAHPVVVRQFPFNLINFLSKKRRSSIKVVISASANNEGYPTEMKGWKSHDISSHRFDNDEFKVWCHQNHLENIGQVDPESEEAVDALFWTGGIPYELDLLWKQPMATLVEKTIEYRMERVIQMRFNHGKFCRTLQDEEKYNLKECISRMALGLSPPNGLEGMDRQLFDIVKDGSGAKIITALNPVARQSLLEYHRQGLMHSLGLVAELVLRGKVYPNTIKGKISEIYITTMLELSKLFAFRFRKVSEIAEFRFNDDSTKSKSIEIESVVHFLKNKLPPKTSFQKKVTTLFVPESPDYPRFDFFLWDSHRQLMMGFQVTVLNPFSQHPKMTNSQMWQRFCFGNSKQTPMELYWVIPKSCVGVDFESVLNDSIIFFEDLYNDFPALQKLILQ